MDIKSRPLNKGEIYGCSFKKAKEIFKDTDIHLSYGVGGRYFGYFLGTPLATYCNKHLFGRVIASMGVCANIQATTVTFYALKKTEFSEELQCEFEEKILPRYLKVFNEVSNLGETTLVYKYLITALYKGKLVYHEVNMH